MDINNRRKLLQDLKSASFLPLFNEELYVSLTQEHQRAIKEVQEIYKQRNDPEFSEKIKPIMSLKLKDIARTKRVQLAYLMFRLEKIQSQYLENSGTLNSDELQYLSKNEKDYYKYFDDLIKNYEKEIDVRISQNIPPPSQAYVQVRVVKQIGSIITQDGEELNLEEGTQQFVRKSDVINFVQNGQLRIIS